MAAVCDVAGKRIFITGSSSGLGYIIAKGLAEEGAHVILNGRDADKLEQARASLEAEGFRVSAYPCSVVDEDAVAQTVARIEDEVGPMDVLINNAGRQHRLPLEQFPLEEWREVIDVNLTGAFIVGKQAAACMIKRRAGKIINVCSLQSELARKTIAPYAAAKGGLKMLTRGMAVDWAPYNIQVNAIAPGYFITSMTQALADNSEFDTWLKQRTPAQRWGSPEELLGAVFLFASEASDFINGQILYVDGGISASI